MVFKHPQFSQTDPEIEVEYPPAAALEGAVSDALANFGGLDASDVSVTATGSTITLSGFIQRPEEAERAMTVARDVPGVGDVRNQLQVGKV